MVRIFILKNNLHIIYNLKDLFIMLCCFLVKLVILLGIIFPCIVMNFRNKYIFL